MPTSRGRTSRLGGYAEGAQSSTSTLVSRPPSFSCLYGLHLQNLRDVPPRPSSRFAFCVVLFKSECRLSAAFSSPPLFFRACAGRSSCAHAGVLGRAGPPPRPHPPPVFCRSQPLLPQRTASATHGPHRRTHPPQPPSTIDPSPDSPDQFAAGLCTGQGVAFLGTHKSSPCACARCARRECG